MEFALPDTAILVSNPVSISYGRKRRMIPYDESLVEPRTPMAEREF